MFQGIDTETTISHEISFSFANTCIPHLVLSSLCTRAGPVRKRLVRVTVRVYVTYLVSTAAIGSICCKCQMERAPTYVPIQSECCRMKKTRLSVVLRWRTRVLRRFASRRGRSFHRTGGSVVWYTWRGIWPSPFRGEEKDKGEEEEKKSRPVLHSASSELWTARCRGTSSGKKTRSLVTRG